MGSFSKQVKELANLEKAKDYPGAKIRPKLQFWDASGCEVDTKSGEQIIKETPKEAEQEASEENSESSDK